MNISATTAIPHALRLLKAEELTRRGQFREAEALLGGGDTQPPDDVLLLHGLATVVTRQGDYLRARRLWRLLQHRQPGHREAERMLAALECWEERPLWVRLAPAASVALLVLGGSLWLWQGSATAETAAPAKAPTTETAPTRVVRPTPVAPVAPASPVYAAPVAPVAPARQAPTPPQQQWAQPVAQEEPAPAVLFKMPPSKPAKR